MTAISRPAPYAASFINRNPEGAALGVVVAGLALLGAMMPAPVRVVAVAAQARVAAPVARFAPVTPVLAPMPATPDALAAALSPADPVAPPPLPSAQAFLINAAMPISALPNPRAMPFKLGTVDEDSHARALDCLTAAIYYEAASESDEGQAAVAQVVLNRVRSPSYPKTVCAVVFDGTADHGGVGGSGGCQFTFTCDGAMTRSPSPSGWARARRAAAAALGGAVAPAVGWSTHYHTQWVAPIWAPTLLKTAVIGAHIFYRQPNRTTVARYAGSEPEIAQMAPLSSVPMTLVPTTGVPATAMAATQMPAGAPGSGTLAMVLPGI